MTDNFLDKVYRVSGNDGMRDLYNAWAGKYDQDILKPATPPRPGWPQPFRRVAGQGRADPGFRVRHRPVGRSAGGGGLHPD
jgi:hypothetical protein